MPGLWKAWKAKGRLPTLSTSPLEISPTAGEISTFPQLRPRRRMEKWKTKSRFPTFPPPRFHCLKNKKTTRAGFALARGSAPAQPQWSPFPPPRWFPVIPPLTSGRAGDQLLWCLCFAACFFRPFFLPLPTSSARSLPLSRSDEAAAALLCVLPVVAAPLPRPGPCAPKAKADVNSKLEITSPFLTFLFLYSHLWHSTSRSSISPWLAFTIKFA